MSRKLTLAELAAGTCKPLSGAGCRLDAAYRVLKDLVGRRVALARIGEGTTDSSGYTRRIVRVLEVTERYE